MGFERSYQVGIPSKFILRLRNKFSILSSWLELQLDLCPVFFSAPPKPHSFVTLPLQSNINFFKIIKDILLEDKAYLHKKFFFFLY